MIRDFVYYSSRIWPKIAKFYYSIPFRGCSVESGLPQRIQLHPPCKISHSVIAPHQGLKLEIGSYSVIGAFSYLGPSLTSIGSYCSIAPFSFIGPIEHDLKMVTTSSSIRGSWSTFLDVHESAYPSFTPYTENPTTIGNDVWVGAQAFIKEGLRIGNGAVIGAGSVVVKNVPPYSVVAGVPAKIVRMRFSEEQIQILSGIDWANVSPKELIGQFGELGLLTPPA